MYGKFCLIKIKNAVAVDQLFGKGVPAAQIVDLFARIIGKIANAVERFFPAQGKIAARNVQAGQEEITRAGRLRKIDDLPRVVGIDARTRKQ